MIQKAKLHSVNYPLQSERSAIGLDNTTGWLPVLKVYWLQNLPSFLLGTAGAEA